MSDALAATPDTDTEASAIDSAVAASSSYELLKKRLQAQGDVLLAKAQALNAARLEAFGQQDQRLLLRTRARTEHACVPRDLVRIGAERVLLGFNVFLGLRRETGVGDVFALYRPEVICMVNRSCEPVTACFADKDFCGNIRAELENGCIERELPPYGAAILIKGQEERA